jgi:hypothetical protein
MKKIKVYDMLAIISTLGIFGWIITDFYGGMIIYFIVFWPIIISIIILYLISFLDTFISIVNNGWNLNKIKGVSHGVLLFVILLLIVMQSELFKSKIILKAILRDDLSNLTLILRKNGKFENEVSGIFGPQEVFKGRYTLKADTIIFQNKPYDNDFLPDTILINRKQKAIFIGKEKNGNFAQEKSFLNYFELIKYKD